MKAANKPRSLAQIAAAIRRRAESLTDIIATGNDLIEVKGRLKHGEWLDWLLREVDFSWSTAENYMAAARLAGKFATVANSKLTPTALYWLADQHAHRAITPAVIEKILAKAKTQRITKADAEAIARPLRRVSLTVTEEMVVHPVYQRDREDAEAILDEPPPELPPAAAAQSTRLPPSDVDPLLADFDEAIRTLARLSTKSASQFCKTDIPPKIIGEVAEFLKYLLDILTRAVA
jgi:hypothetical protein